ncbi:hypothetical protein ACOMHN_054643 [Nucella lapillus]
MSAVPPDECLSASLYRCGFCYEDFLTLDSCLTHVAAHGTSQQDSAAPTSLLASRDQQQGTASATVPASSLASEDHQQQAGHLVQEGTIAGRKSSAAASVHTERSEVGSPSSVMSSEPSYSVSPATSERSNAAVADRATVSGAEPQQNSIPVKISEPPQNVAQQDTILVHAHCAGAFIIDSTPSKSEAQATETRNGNLENGMKVKSQPKEVKSETVDDSFLWESPSGEDGDKSGKQAGDTASSGLTTERQKRNTVSRKNGRARYLGANSKDGDRLYACSECPARYRFLSSLSVHKKRHSGTEPYQCKTCKKKFWHPTNMRVHERVHSKKRLYNCSVCGHGFNQSNDLRIHMRIHTGETPLKCPVEDCSRAFRDPACLRRHMNKHRGVEPHIACDQCPAKFFHPSGLARHYKRHTGQKDHVCPFCSTAFARADTLKLHMRIHSGHKPYVCSVCDQSFSDRSYCRRHIAKHDESQQPRVISTFQDKNRVIKEEAETKTEVIMAVEQDASHMPPQCVTMNKVPVEIHVPDSSQSDIPYASIEIEIPESDLVSRDGSDEVVYKYKDMLITISRSALGLVEGAAPETEGGVVSGSSALVPDQLPSTSLSTSLQQTEHQYSRASVKPEEEDILIAQALNIEAAGGSEYVTQVAGGLNPVVVKTGVSVPQPLSEYNEMVTTVLEAELVEGKEQPFRIIPAPKHKPHAARVARFGDRRWPCPSCDAAFFHQAELKRHQTKHTGELPYQCNVCGKKVRDPSNLKRHVRTHTGERPYSCYVCGKTFRQAGHLSAHVRIHTGQRPYKCKVCPATFIEANHLRYHQKVHDGIKPYQCPQCDLSFIRNAELKRHSHVHAQGAEGNLKCHLCPAKFFRSDALRQHLSKKHDQSLPYQCDVCSQSFYRQSLLDRHCLRANHASSRTPGLHPPSPPPESVQAPPESLKPSHPESLKASPESLKASPESLKASPESLKHPPPESDTENSVVADALCELAAGGRSSSSSSALTSSSSVSAGKTGGRSLVSTGASLASSGRSVVSSEGSLASSGISLLSCGGSLVLDNAAGSEGGDLKSPTVRQSAFPLVIVAEEDMQTDMPCENGGEVVEGEGGERNTGSGYRGDHFVRKVVVEGGSVLGARVVLVESDDSARMDTLQNIHYNEGVENCHNAQSVHQPRSEPHPSSSLSGPHSVTSLPGPQADNDRLFTVKDKPRILVANRNLSPARASKTQVVATNGPGESVNDNSSVITTGGADSTPEPAVSDRTVSADKIPGDSLITVFASDNAVTIQNYPSPGTSDQFDPISRMIKQETDNPDDPQSQIVPEGSPSEQATEKAVADAAQSTFRAKQSEAASCREAEEPKPTRGKRGKRSGNGSSGNGSSGNGSSGKREAKESGGGKPFVAPLRTRSGRERKIKVKVSL